jgi:hypothetical protein
MRKKKAIKEMIMHIENLYTMIKSDADTKAIEHELEYEITAADYFAGKLKKKKK